MTRGWRWRAAGVALALAAATGGLPQGQGALGVSGVNPRPRLLFAPGEYGRLVAETTGVRRAAFERMTAEIEDRKTANWNDRDMQIESQALASRVLLDRHDARGPRYLGYARASVQRVLATHLYNRFPDSHDLVTDGARWLESMALAHDWLYPYWTAEERAALEDWLATELTYWIDTNQFRRASSSPFRNDLARGVAGMVLTALTLYDVPMQSGVARRALGYVQPHYNAIIAAHAYAGLRGGMAEGTFYGNFTAWAQTLIAEALYTAAGVQDAYTRTPFYAARLRYAIHASWPGYLTNQFGYNVNQLAPVFGDARRGPTGSALYHRATVLLLGKRFPNSQGAREAYYVVNRPETSRTYVRDWSLFDVLFWSPDVQPTPPTTLSYYESSLGQVFARSDWSDDATWMSFNAGPHLDTHQHYDAGNLTIFRRVDLAVDSGVMDGFGSSHWFNYYVRTVAHNTITIMDPAERWKGIWGGVPDDRAVNDGGQRTAAPLTPAPTLAGYLENRTAYDQGRIERYADGAWGAYARANLTNAYQNPAFQSTKPDGSRNRPKVSHVGREIVYLRGEGRRDAFVVFDRVVATDASFKKAVLWHAREPFESKNRAIRVDEGEIHYAGSGEYSFESLVEFTEGPRDSRARLFVTAIAIDPIVVRAVGRRIHTDTPDHVTFDVPHYHRHVKDYYVDDPRPLMNTNRTTGATGRPEWPPFVPPEQQWLWTDDLVGGWGQTRLQIEPSAQRLADRFLTVLVPTDEGASAPDVLPVRAAMGEAAGAVVRQGGRNDVVVFSANPTGAELTRAAVDVNLDGRTGDLTLVDLTPGARYSIRMGGGLGRVQRIAIEAAPDGGLVADAAGVVRTRLDAVPRVAIGGVAIGSAGGASAPGAGGIGSSATAPAGSEAAGSAANGPGTAAGHHPGFVPVNADTPAAIASWEQRIASMSRRGELKLRETATDAALQGRTYERLTQMYKDVPVYGGELTRSRDDGRTVAIYGSLYGNIDVDTRPALSPTDAADLFADVTNGSPLPNEAPELVVLPTDDGKYALTYRMRVPQGKDVRMMFMDAETGEILRSVSALAPRH
jgi:heparinase II/III-like protein/fungalysin/thermolysin propeptide